MSPDGTPSEILGPGAEIWALLKEPLETDALVEATASEYSTARDVVASDVQRLLDQLHADGYVDRTD